MSQAAGNRSSARVIPLDRDTRGTKMEPSNKNIKTSIILQDVASLVSKILEESTTSGAEKAAKRRYMKQLRETGRKRQELSVAASKLKDKKKGVTVVGAHKFEAQHPQFTGNRQDERPKVTDQETQATKGIIRLALVLDHPDKNLSVQDVIMVRKLIRGRILGLPESTVGSTFISIWERDDAIIVL